MNQLQDKQRTYTNEGQPYYPPSPYGRAEVHHYHHQGHPRHLRPFPIGLVAFLPFWMGIMAAVVAVFVVDDPRWLITRMAAALCILFMLGMVGSVVGGVWMAIRDQFTKDSWRGYYDE